MTAPPTSTEAPLLDPRTGGDTLVRTIADVLERVDDGSLDYGTSNARGVAAALRKCAGA